MEIIRDSRFTNSIERVSRSSSDEKWRKPIRISTYSQRIRLYTLRFLDISIIIKIFNHPSRWLFSLSLSLSLRLRLHCYFAVVFWKPTYLLHRYSRFDHPANLKIVFIPRQVKYRFEIATKSWSRSFSNLDSKLCPELI